MTLPQSLSAVELGASRERAGRTCPGDARILSSHLPLEGKLMGDWPPDHEGARRADVDGIEVLRFGRRVDLGGRMSRWLGVGLAGEPAGDRQVQTGEQEQQHEDGQQRLLERHP
jgi:hypothetical protein